jgi:hypothetical protein
MLLSSLSDSGGHAAVDFHDVPIVPAASGVSSVPAVVGLPACCCITIYASIPALGGVHTALADLLLLLFLLFCMPFCC